MTTIERVIYNINETEALARGSSRVHGLLPVTKVLLLAGFIVAVISFPPYEITGLLPMFLFPAGFVFWGKLPAARVFSQPLIALPFVLFAGMSNIISDRSTAAIVFGLNISYGVIACLSLIIKTALTISAAAAVISTTEIMHVCSALIYLKLPRVVAVQLLLCYRYITVLLTEVNNMLTAYQLRSCSRKGVRLRDAGSFAGQLLLRSFTRAGNIYDAMKCRGFTGDLFLHSDNMDTKNWLVAFVGLGCIFLLRVYSF